jgi:solute carrier family 8 (sodium/calcium exchanger)
VIPFNVFLEKLFPTIHLYWKKYKQDRVSKLKATGQNLAIAGDGRHDSMGHSAKYCAYTLFCCTVPLIIDFSLIQVG